MDAVQGTEEGSEHGAPRKRLRGSSASSPSPSPSLLADLPLACVNRLALALNSGDPLLLRGFLAAACGSQASRLCVLKRYLPLGSAGTAAAETEGVEVDPIFPRAADYFQADRVLEFRGADSFCRYYAQVCACLPDGVLQVSSARCVATSAQNPCCLVLATYTYRATLLSGEGEDPCVRVPLPLHLRGSLALYLSPRSLQLYRCEFFSQIASPV